MNDKANVPDSEPPPDPDNEGPPDDEMPAVFRGMHLDVAPDQHVTAPRPAASEEPSDELRSEARVSSTRPPAELRTEFSGAPTVAPGSAAHLDVESLFLEHYDKLFAAMRRFCAGDDILAEEITQETFLQAYRRQHSLVSVANPYAWLLVVARNTARAYFRRQGRQREKEHRNYLLQSREGIEEKEEWLLEDLLDQLPERERRALEYRFVFDYDVRTIARKMGVCRRSVNNYIDRALRRIRRGLNLPEEG